MGEQPILVPGKHGHASPDSWHLAVAEGDVALDGHGADEGPHARGHGQERHDIVAREGQRGEFDTQARRKEGGGRARCKRIGEFVHASLEVHGAATTTACMRPTGLA